ncbi:isoprenylcysteine carboxylmethyltransferase family protein [Pseudomonas sp. L-22-4S-12]|uniref:methyltransferase family protein n=1 Tax=Pseudomonas sp. L-22-4S-12 TaxID=2610893 RepID=UPI001328DA1F|nr:isoprenylcysteine carboxylmethyltransferase family protein [Pseudomonas sp. L-22-4S-12]MWV16780.1 isoprenylcysteine carboxylmethyltransferase family protein [Pseudomonas sp. L-22-4S-12]
MSKALQLLQSRQVNFLSGFVLAALWAAFAYVHILKFQKTAEVPLLLFFLAETLTALFFLFRSTPQTISSDPKDWLLAIGGTFLPLLLRPAAWGIVPAASIALVAGVGIQILALLSLNRSFALVAAKREIKTSWMYRIVRHPIYASYFLTLTGYVLTNTTLQNLVIYATTLAFLCARIFKEEKHLALDPSYRQYMLDVRYRLFPYIF